MVAEPFGEIARPTILPAAFADAAVEPPWNCCVNPGKLSGLLPPDLCVNSPLARQSTDTTPLGPAKVRKFGLPVVLGLSRREVRPPLKSPFGISPKPSRVTLQEKVASHSNTK